MPEKDGIETVREILAFDPAAVIFTMSGQDADYQETAQMLGAKRGFEKPLEMEHLLEVIRTSVLRNASAQHE